MNADMFVSEYIKCWSRSFFFFKKNNYMNEKKVSVNNLKTSAYSVNYQNSN